MNKSFYLFRQTVKAVENSLIVLFSRTVVIKSRAWFLNNQLFSIFIQIQGIAYETRLLSKSMHKMKQIKALHCINSKTVCTNYKSDKFKT